MRVLVTGGAGFIASNITDALIAAGHSVAIVDDLSTGKRENLNPHAVFHHLDIRDERVGDIFRSFKPEAVVHHAAQMDVRRSVREPVYDADVNIGGSIKLMEWSREVGTRRFLYAGTGGAFYGNPSYMPVREDHPINPISHYGVSKHTVEHYLFLYQELYGLNYTAFRYPNVYGPRQDPHGEAGVTAIFTEKMLTGVRPRIFGDGEDTRDYVFIDDIVKANLLALESDKSLAINLGWGEEISVNRIYRELAELTSYGEPPEYAPARPGEIGRICLDATKAKAELGWQPTITFHEGLVRLVAYWRQKLGS